MKEISVWSPPPAQQVWYSRIQILMTCVKFDKCSSVMGKKGLKEAAKKVSWDLADEVKVFGMEIIRRTNRANLLVMPFL